MTPEEYAHQLAEQTPPLSDEQVEAIARIIAAEPEQEAVA